MLVLPNTPVPKNTSIAIASLTTQRASTILPLSNYNECIKYTAMLEEYILTLLKLDQSQKLCGEVPWTNISSSSPQWSVMDEIQTAVYSMALVYIRVGSELANQLIERDPSLENDSEWRLVAEAYRTSILFAKFGESISNEDALNPDLNTFGDSSYNFPLVVMLAEISSQMAILAKFSWVNRSSLIEYNDVAKNSNNGTLARVAIYVVSELGVVSNLVAPAPKQSFVSKFTNKTEADPEISHTKTPNTTAWPHYLSIVTRYSSAYAAMFLLIENYQQNKIGHALGLVRFALIKLQSKYTISGDKKGRLEKIRGIREKIVSKRNEQLLKRLSALLTLDMDKLVFGGDVVLNDLSYLFDLLIQLNVKYEKENSMLGFEEVVDWKDIEGDTKWPMGAKIPMSKVEPWGQKEKRSYY